MCSDVVSNDYGCIEFHDARIDCIRIASDSHVTIEFSHICIYDADVDSDEFDGAWSSQAKLELEGTHNVSIRGKIDEGDYVTIGNLEDLKGCRFSVVNYAITSESKHCDLLLAGSGTSIRASFDRAFWSEIIRNEKIT